jgi:hypothetical protein
MFNGFPKFYSRRIFITVFTPPHPVNPNPEPGEFVLHLDAPAYLRSPSGKPAENFTEGFNEYCLWLRFLQIIFFRITAGEKCICVIVICVTVICVTVIPPTIRTFK